MAIREPAAGELNRRITLRLRTDLPAADFGVSPVFTEQKKRWASIVPVGSAVYAAGIQIDAKVTHRITLYYLAGLSEAHEVVHGSKLYRIQRVTDLNGAHQCSVLEVEELGVIKARGSIYG